MKRMILALFIVIFGSSNLFSQEVDKKLHQQCLYPTIYIGNLKKNTYGSGVIIKSDKVKDNEYKNVFITCNHLFYYGDYMGYEVKQYLYEDWSQVKDTITYPCYVYGTNPDLDLAVGVFYSEKEMPTAKINLNPKLFIGNDIFRIGCGLGEDPRLDYGKITGYKNNIPKPHIKTSVHTIPGDSGSPVFQNYEIIGIMVSIRSMRNIPIFNISYAMPVRGFKVWSERNNNNLDFIFGTKKLPEFPFLCLRMKEYEM